MLLVAALAGPLLAACAAKSRVPPPPAPTPATGETGADGIYRGTSTRFRASGRGCPSPGLVVLRIVNGAFQYRWNGRTDVDATVSPDGAVAGTLGDIALEGRVTAGRIEGDVQSPACAYHFRASKRGA